MTTADEKMTKTMTEVMLAYVNGQRIQFHKRGSKSDWEDTTLPLWDWINYEYRIKPEEPKPKRMTRRQLAEWCAKGNGQWMSDYNPFTYLPYYSYSPSSEDEEFSDHIKIRLWGSNEWIEPTEDIYLRDCCGR